MKIKLDKSSFNQGLEKLKSEYKILAPKTTPFKGTFSDNLPVYFKDTINYEHIVTLGNINTPVTANQLVNNFPYPALYVANYIVLNPSQQTLDDFKNGLIT